MCVKIHTASKYSALQLLQQADNLLSGLPRSSAVFKWSVVGRGLGTTVLAHEPALYQDASSEAAI